MRGRGLPVSDDKVAWWLNEIGRLIAEKEDPSKATLLYVQIGRAWVSPSLFRDRGNHILYEECLERLAEPLLDFWYSQRPRNRWAELHYVVRDGKFDALFVYPNELDPKEGLFISDRRDRIVAKYLGEKPVMYPPPDEDEADTFKL